MPKFNVGDIVWQPQHNTGKPESAPRYKIIGIDTDDWIRIELVHKGHSDHPLGHVYSGTFDPSTVFLWESAITSTDSLLLLL